MIESGTVDGVDEAIILGDRMMQKGVFRHVTNAHSFKNQRLFYRFAADDYAAMKKQGKKFGARQPSSDASSDMSTRLSKVVVSESDMDEVPMSSGSTISSVHNKDEPGSPPKEKPKERVVKEVASTPQDDFAVKFDDIAFKRKIGGGAFATVYEAEWLHTPVAIKLFREEMLAETNPLLSQRGVERDGESSAGARQEFVNECRLLSRLRHPNIVLYLAASAEAGKPLCMIQQLYRGGSLGDFLARQQPKRLPLAKSLHIAVGIARGLHYLHAQDPQILHRDLKSDNVLMNKVSLEPAIADMGLSCIRRNDDLTRVGGGYMVGTVTSMAPEIMEGKRYTAPSDIYSLSIVLWEVFTCRRAFADCSSGVQLMFKVAQGERPKFAPDDGVPARIQRLIELGWDADMSRRPKLREFVDTLSAEAEKVDESL